MRTIIYTGRENEGKTSISYLSAVNLANKGKKVLFVSFEKIDFLNINIKDSPQLLKENLWA